MHEAPRVIRPGGRISVVVPTRDRPELLEGCLAALRSSLREGDELIVADSASSDGRVRSVAESAGARVVRCDAPGASVARNAGWHAAAHDVIAFVDDDVRVRTGWADAVAAAFEDPAVGFITGRIGLPEGVRPERKVAIRDEPDARWLDGEASEEAGHSANVAVRREALEAIGGFDERLGAGAEFRAAEDLDLFDRLARARYRGRYEPSAAATHEQWRDRRAIFRLEYAYGYGMGARVAKLWRTDRPRARHAADRLLWEGGLKHVARKALARSRLSTARRGLRVLGGVAGLVAAARRPVLDGHLTGPGQRSSRPVPR